MKDIRLLVLLLAICIQTPLAFAKGVYLSEAAFLTEAFGNATPERHSLWLRGELKASVKKLLGYSYGKIRLHYWRKDNTTAWILEQIGKDKPITAGFVINGQQIVQAHVMAFRETRGWEIKRQAFTKQFEMAELTTDHQLSKHIDGITGATLSVNAMNRMAKLALLFDQEVQTHFSQQQSD